MMSHFETKAILAKADEIDQLIKQGATQKAVQLLLSIAISEIPRAQRLSFAKLYRRLGMNTKGLRTLTSIVRPNSPLSKPASSQELCEYGVLLSRVGSLSEAKSMLKSVDPEVSKESLLYLSFCHISEWNYQEALPLLKSYEEKINDEYQKLISKVNQVACLIALELYDEAKILVEESLAGAEALSATRLRANLFELRGQIFVGLQRFNEAIVDLKNARELLGQARTYDETFIEKWLAYIDATNTGSVQPLLDLRQKAKQYRHWEVVRDIDFMCLRIRFEKERYHQLVAGSHSPFYKEKVIQKLKQACASSHRFGEPKADELDLENGSWKGEALFKNEGKMLSLLRSLASDFYFPMSAGAIHSSLYPDEYYNVDSTPLKIRQQIFRLRKLLSAQNIPLQIMNEGESYFLELGTGVGLKVSSFNEYKSKDDAELELIKKNLGTQFGAQEACKVLSLSRSHFLRKAELWLKEGRVEKQGRGRGTKYRLPKAS